MQVFALFWLLCCEKAQKIRKTGKRLDRACLEWYNKYNKVSYLTISFRSFRGLNR